MKKIHYNIIFSICLLLVGCDHITEDEQLIYVKPEPAQRVVLLEDFTGQKCPNCPAATEIIEQLLETYGDAVVAVSIHGGQLSVANTPKVIGLKTDTGEDYNKHWNLTQWPMGMIDRHGPFMDNEWVTVVKDELAKPAPLHLEGVAYQDGEVVNIQVKAMGTDGNVNGKLQVWLLEDGIEAMQMKKDLSTGSTKILTDYIHNHVFRTAVNGTWGEDFSVEEGKTIERPMTQALDPNWNKEQLSIVAFVYNDDGVQQVTKFKVQ